MEIKEFKQELIDSLSSLDYIEDIEILEEDDQSLVHIKKRYILKIRFAIQERRYTFTLSFTLLFENKRIWGLDRDNRIGWHIHPLNNVSVHESIEPKEVREIVTIFNSMIQTIV